MSSRKIQASSWLVRQRKRGRQAQRHEVFPGVARRRRRKRRFPSIYTVTQAKAWTQALPGPVTQFPQFYRSITTQGLLFSFEEALEATLGC